MCLAPKKPAAKKPIKAAAAAKALPVKKPAQSGMRPHAVADFETFYDDDCSVKTLGAAAYSRHPRFEAYLVSIYTGPGGISYVGHPSKAPWNALVKYQMVAHNSQFDWTIYNTLRELKKIKGPDLGVWRDSAALSAFCGAPRDLMRATRELLGGDNPKDLRAWMKGKTWEDAVAAGKGKALQEYAMGDAKNAWEIYNQYAHLMPAEEWAIAEWTVSSAMHGIQLDMKLLKKWTTHLTRVLAEIESRIPWMNDSNEDAKPTSSKLLGIACRQVGIPPPKSTAKSSEEFEDWLDEYADRAPFVAAMREYRTVNRVLGVLHAMNQRQVDGILYWSKKYYGAHTGRWSGDGGLNMENFQRDDVHGVNPRRLMIARKSKALVVADFAQIEARILLWFANDMETLKLIATGMSVYEAHARQTMGWTGGKLKDEDDRLYRLAKARVLGLGFGCGDEKFVRCAKTMAGISITRAESVATVKAYREANPGVAGKKANCGQDGLWERLQNEILAATNRVKNPNGSWILDLPSGRQLRYFDVKRMKHAKFGTQTMAQSWLGTPHKSVYGGLLTENLVQATARDVLRDGVLRLIEAGYQPLFTVHDEVVVEVPEKTNVNKVKDLLCTTPEWLDGCPMDVEIEKTQHYS